MHHDPGAGHEQLRDGVDARGRATWRRVDLNYTKERARSESPPRGLSRRGWPGRPPLPRRCWRPPVRHLPRGGKLALWRGEVYSFGTSRVERLVRQTVGASCVATSVGASQRWAHRLAARHVRRLKPTMGASCVATTAGAKPTMGAIISCLAAAGPATGVRSVK